MLGAGGCGGDGGAAGTFSCAAGFPTADGGPGTTLLCAGIGLIFVTS
ncbi:MAG TPA: hypothetical protein VGP07_10470 [Polyangia bacterium]